METEPDQHIWPNRLKRFGKFLMGLGAVTFAANMLPGLESPVVGAAGVLEFIGGTGLVAMISMAEGIPQTPDAS